VTRLQKPGFYLRSRSHEAVLSHNSVRRIGLRPSLPVLIQVLWGGKLLHAQKVLGSISTVAGRRSLTGYTAKPTRASSNKLGKSLGESAIDPVGNFYFTDTRNKRSWWGDTTGVITTIAGARVGKGYAGDGGPTTAHILNFPTIVVLQWVQQTGVIFFADNVNNRSRFQRWRELQNGRWRRRYRYQCKPDRAKNREDLFSAGTLDAATCPDPSYRRATVLSLAAPTKGKSCDTR
jgi:hypothetical protein